ncbi:MAG: DUF481 domain-containing protein [Deltaproteobacteria bacterium]|nr:DUF481 domain-containing protein [Deltaproteobacteria bacterium]
MQGALLKPPTTDAVVGTIELKLDWREGNNSLFDISGTGTVLAKQGRVLLLGLARGGYGKSRGFVLTRKSFEHVRARVTLDCRWKWEAFGQHEFDQFKRLTLRAIVGTGPALQIIDRKTVGLLAGAAYLYSYERLDQRAGTIDAGVRFFEHRASLYLTGRQLLGENATLIQTIYVQPRIDDPGDVRVLGELALISKLSTRIALTNGFTIAYDRTPPDQIRRFDTELKVGIIVTF